METHVFRLSQIKPQYISKGGTKTVVSKSNFSLLQGMSLYKLTLQPSAVREPHWHANADELGYCLKGNLLVSLFAAKNVATSFIVKAGEAFFIPSGSLHAIENIGDDKADLILQFSHEEPEDFALSSTFGMFSDAVLGNTWSVPSSVFHDLKRSTKEVFIALRQSPATIPSSAYYASPYRYHLQDSFPLVANSGGSAKVARENVWPILKKQALYSLELTGTGMREPHWHPQTAEMGFVHSGRARMSILLPSGDVDTYILEAGDLYFIPPAYPHHIENMNETPLHILIFFNQSMPADIGFTASVKSFSNEALTAVFGAPQRFFESLPTYYEDLFIVSKKNPPDHSFKTGS